MRPIYQHEAEALTGALKTIASYRNPAATQDGAEGAARLARETLDRFGLLAADSDPPPRGPSGDPRFDAWDGPAHGTIALQHPHHGAISIDAALAPLINALWRAGIDTVQSCQELRPGFAWIAFASPVDGLAFLDAAGIRENLRDPLTIRCCDPEVASPSSERDPWGWVWSVLPRPADRLYDIAVEIPHRDIPELLNRLARQT